MRESLKMICVVAIIFGSVSAALTWVDQRPTTLVWLLRIGSPVLCVLALVGFLALHFRRDIAPDLLRKYFGTYFDRSGFCFSIGVSSPGGVCTLVIPFQNRHERPCMARIALRPGKSFFASHQADLLNLQLFADSGEFGICRVPIAMPAPLQGKVQRFEVGADVEYPNGKGRALRFANGITLRTNSRFENLLNTATTFVHFVHMPLLLLLPHRNAAVRLKIPQSVAQTLPDECRMTVKTFWKLGDSIPSLWDLSTQISGA
jgi:hypothetical protein